MEAEDGYEKSGMKTSTMTAWQGDWASFKRRLKAAGILNGIQEAMQMGDTLASKGAIPMKNQEEEVEKWNKKLVQQSERLAALLLLSLESTKGPQQSLVINRSMGTEENGVLMWADLVRHFEKSSKELRMSALQKEWERNTLKAGEHPNELYGRLVTINSKMEGLGGGYTAEQLKMRFVAAIEEREDGMYTNAIQQYRGTQIEGSGWSLDTLLEFLTHIYDIQKQKPPEKPEMKGLIIKEIICDHCKRHGHKKDQCWELNPEKRPEIYKRKNRIIKCYKCGKVGHIRKNCKKNTSKGNNFIAATLNKNCIDCYKKTYIDTASSCHTVISLKLLDKETIQNVDETVRTANGDVIRLTHKGKRTIPTKQGVVILNEVYYGPGLRYNLLSVPRMNELGTNVTFNNDKAYMNKNRNVIPLRKIDGLWALPEEESKLKMASLRMERGGTANAET